MEGNIGYKEAMGIISEVEVSSQEILPQEIDVDKILKGAEFVTGYNYNEASKIIGKIEGPQFGISMPSYGPQRPPSPEKKKHVQLPSKKAAPKIAGTGKELRGVFGRMSDDLQKSMAKKEERKYGNLVLPNLAIQDQIAELEKISLGLDENVFNPGQLSIIKEELRGLQKKTKREVPQEGTEENLFGLRNQLLGDVLTKMGMKHG